MRLLTSKCLHIVGGVLIAVALIGDISFEIYKTVWFIRFIKEGFSWHAVCEYGGYTLLVFAIFIALMYLASLLDNMSDNYGNARDKYSK